ncbi:Probable long-chain-alcohol O-fatty-acyltransferase 5 [Linum perenne]
MEEEVIGFIKVWTWATLCLSYAYFISSKLNKGIPRLLSLIPVFYLFFITLPLSLNSIHLGCTSAFFLAWLATSKLLLFSFDLPPLSPPPPRLIHFISIACLPIKLRSNLNNHDPATPSVPKSKILFLIKFILLLTLFSIYDYRHLMHPYFIFALYCLHLYLELELVLALCALPARALFGFELEPQFDEPYLSTSLQDFWGRRWNLIVTNILRPTVYLPIRHVAGLVIGRRWSSLPAVVATFAVSGLMHELMYYYMNRVRPTWEVTWFFVIHGVCVAVEVAFKKKINRKDWLPPVVSVPLTVGFVGVTGVWLFFPQILRNGAVERVIAEYSLFVRFFWTRFTNFLPSFS